MRSEGYALPAQQRRVIIDLFSSIQLFSFRRWPSWQDLVVAAGFMRAYRQPGLDLEQLSIDWGCSSGSEEGKMDITTLAYAVAIAFGLLVVDAAVYSGTIVIDVVGPSKKEKLDVDQEVVQARFNHLVSDVVATRSLLRPPEVIW